jgi:chaperonin GroEL
VLGTKDRVPLPTARIRPSSETKTPEHDTDISKTPPGLRFSPDALVLMQRGIDTIANAVRPTLGPTARTVAMGQIMGSGSRPPEILDNAATIARRIVEIPNPYANVGAMLIRHTMWDVQEHVGDGSATAAVIMQALLREGLRLQAAGWNVMRMRHGIERGLDEARTVLHSMARPIETEADVAGLALAAYGDPDLAKRLGEIFDTLGQDGHVEVNEVFTPGISHEYIEGAFWKSGWISSSMATNQLQTEARLENPYVLVVRDRIENWDEISPLFEAVSSKSGSLFIIALDVTGTALNLILSNKEKVKCVAVKTPGWGDYMEDVIVDIATLTGTRVIMKNFGESVKDVKLDDLGRARIVTVNRDYFGITGGAGNPRQVRERIAMVRQALSKTDMRESEAIQHLRERLGKLTGGVAIIYVCGHTPPETLMLKATVERTVNTVKQAQLGGIVPGGGMSYLRCIPAIRRLKLPRDQEVGIDALERALEEPLRVIAANAGYDASPIAFRAREQKDGWGFNAHTGKFEDLWASGVVDPLTVAERALVSAVSGAVMALTTSVTVHRKNPPTSVEP